MSKTILAEVDGFTPIIDTVLKELGLMSAVVFGRMWRFTQMEDGVCKASLAKIAEGIDVDKATVMRHADKLCEAGYLKDLTPDAKNVPHVYVDTGKAGIRIALTTVAESNTTVAQSNATVAQSHLKKDSKKQPKREKKEQGASAPPATSLPEIQLYRSVTNQYPAKASQYTVLVKMNDVQNRLGRRAALDDLMPFYRAWCDRGYNPRAVTWLEWAASGVIPTNGKPANRNASILADFAERNGLNG